MQVTLHIRPPSASAACSRFHLLTSFPPVNPLEKWSRSMNDITTPSSPTILLIETSPCRPIRFADSIVWLLLHSTQNDLQAVYFTSLFANARLETSSSLCEFSISSKTDPWFWSIGTIIHLSRQNMNQDQRKFGFSTHWRYRFVQPLKSGAEGICQTWIWVIYGPGTGGPLPPLIFPIDSHSHLLSSTRQVIHLM